MHKPTILAVDDIPDNLLVLRAIISRYCSDCKIIEAESASKALSILSETDVDVILADVLMPQMDGIEMCRRIKANEKTAHIPIILITAHEITTKIKVKGIEAGADDFITKPVDHAELTARIKIMLRIKKSEDILRMEKETLKDRADKSTKALSESEKLLKLAMEGTGDSIWDWNMETGQIFFDEHWAAILGYDPGKNKFDFEWWQKSVHSQSIPVFEEALNAYKEGRKKYYELEYRMQTKIGDWKWIWARGRYSGFDEHGQPSRMTGTHRDITLKKKTEEEKKNFEKQLQHNQKLEAIGTLAGGVAHEINNPINGIMNYAQLIKDGLDPESSLIEYAEEIILETQRVASIVSNLLTFARQENQNHSPARMSDIIQSTLFLIRIVIRQDQIDLQVEIPDNLPDIKCRSQSIRQVLMNLLINAKDSLNEKYQGYDANKIIRVSSTLFIKKGRKWIRTSVEDNGIGITPEIQQLIFDPFFTTKPRDSGTGLGLSISFGIVKDHHGELHVESEPGQYTRFHLDLPVDNGWDLDKD